MNIEIPYRPDGGPAFPTEDTAHPGISRRDYFAAAALQGLLASGDDIPMRQNVVLAYDYAEEMLEHQEKLQKSEREHPSTPTQVDLVEQLYDENKALKEHIKRLEEAGHPMAEFMGRDDLIYGRAFCKQVAAEWRKVIEAKP